MYKYAILAQIPQIQEYRLNISQSPNKKPELSFFRQIQTLQNIHGWLFASIDSACYTFHTQEDPAG